jgi:YD repeat-containing protein
VRSVGFTQTGNNLATIRDPLGFITTHDYDSTNAIGGLMISATMPKGNIPYRQTFDASGRVATQTVAPSNTHTLTYATNVVTVTDPLGRTRH